MLKTQKFTIADIYVPVKRRKALNAKMVADLAQNILERGQRSPILVRKDGERFVLVEGLHRLEACKSLGETKIKALFVQARKSCPGRHRRPAESWDHLLSQAVDRESRREGAESDEHEDEVEDLARG